MVYIVNVFKDKLYHRFKVGKTINLTSFNDRLKTYKSVCPESELVIIGYGGIKEEQKAIKSLNENYLNKWVRVSKELFEVPQINTPEFLRLAVNFLGIDGSNTVKSNIFNYTGCYYFNYKTGNPHRPCSSSCHDYWVGSNNATQ